MQRFCSYCLKTIERNEPTLELVIGLVHEKCYLIRRQTFFKEKLDEISKFPDLLKSFRQTSNRMISMLGNIIAKGLHNNDHAEFCREWADINRNVIEFNVRWYIVRDYMAQSNWVDRFLSGLKHYKFVAARAPSESQKSNRLMNRILGEVTSYSIALIDQSSAFPEKKTRTKPEEHLKELKSLAEELGKITTTISLKAPEDFQKYANALQRDYTLWCQKNATKLSKYEL